MAGRAELIERLDLTGLTLAPPQLWRGIRLVPVLRRGAPGDLRLSSRSMNSALTVAVVEQSAKHATIYASFVPHALVVDWADDGQPLASFGAQLEPAIGRRPRQQPCLVRMAHRMAKREGRRRLRLLPLHLALEGFLALHFGGPDVMWQEYAREAYSRGLSPRIEESVGGGALPGLADALRLFEIHTDQVGSILFTGEELASVFVVSHPDDYRRLHRSLLHDFFGEELLFHDDPAAAGWCTLDDSASTLADLRAALAGMREQWAAFGALHARDLLGRAVSAERVYTMGPFVLQRFITDLSRSQANHLGEAILREDGTVEYLKSYRLSAAQTRRAYLLRELAAHRWNLEATAASQRQSTDELVLRLEQAGFGYILKAHVIEEARRRRRR